MVQLTSRAAKQIQHALGSKGLSTFGLRVQLVGGGCEGFLYDLLYTDLPDQGDHVFESEGVKIFVDAKTLPAIRGLTIDHAPTKYGEGFVFNNPRAKSACSCGASFSA
ncbi:MAG: HesB/IscA family protein [Myxococcaceae bacterium]